MSSTTPPSGPSPLSARERQALETMVHHECRHDPAFVARLTTWTTADDGPAPTRPRRRGPGALVAVVVALVVLGVLVGLALAGLVALAAVGVVLMLVAPVAVVLWAGRRASR